MVVLFVHGMGRSPISGWPMLKALRRTGVKTDTFGYSSAFESFDSIKSRLALKIKTISNSGSYVVVGHSLGGVLLRAALNSLPKDVAGPRHVVLLGSPIQSPCLAQRLKGNIVYRMFTGDCGQLLASPDRMALLDAPVESAISIVGIKNIALTKRFFKGKENDGVVSVEEASANWLSDSRAIKAVHTFLPLSRQATKIIQRLISEIS